MIKFIIYLSDNTIINKIWKYLPESIQEIIYWIILNFFLFPAIFNKFYYHFFSKFYSENKLKFITIEDIKSSEQIQQENHDLLLDTLLDSDLTIFKINNDYKTLSVLVDDKSDLLHPLKLLKLNSAIYISFLSILGHTISIRLSLIPSFCLRILISLSDSLFINQRYQSSTKRVLFAERTACTLDIWLNSELYYKNIIYKNKAPMRIASRKWLADNKLSIDKINFKIKKPKVYPDFPIDFVYTWVDHNDTKWQTDFIHERKKYDKQVSKLNTSFSISRYTNRDELRYSLRSISMYGNFFRKLYIVTSGQKPQWLDTDNPRIELIHHNEIFSDPECLPTFNSHAIESRLHHIKDLSEHFIYFNDDIFIGRSISPNLFFVDEHISYIFKNNVTFIGLNDPNEIDLPADAAAKNNRNIILHKFNKIITEKFLHTPHFLRKSIMFEIEKKFQSYLLATTSNKFRSIKDISLTSSLYQHYSYYKGYSTEGKISNIYIDLDRKNFVDRLDFLLSQPESKRPDTFCINEIEKESYNNEADNIIILKFLENYYPLKCEFEK